MNELQVKIIKKIVYTFGSLVNIIDTTILNSFINELLSMDINDSRYRTNFARVLWTKEYLIL